MATPLLVALVVIETTDLIFALDSIPAVFAVTRDPFLVYTSNVFALLGLRSLYFVLAGAIRELRFLRTGLGIMLLFVAAKMLLADVDRDSSAGVARRRRGHLRRGHRRVAAVSRRDRPAPERRRRPPARTATRSATCSPRPTSARSACSPATTGSTCACASPAATSGAATARRTGTRRSTSKRPAIRSCARSSRARTGSGAMSIA